MNWLLFVYKVPSEPSARRVYVWRKLKRMGAILLHDSAWVLPATARTRENLQWLAAEITEMTGEAFLWESSLLLYGQDAALEQQFRTQVDEEYQSILTALAQPDCDVEALARRYQQATTQDYFQSAFSEQVREALIAARGGNES
jgi:hypothetical protein